MFDSPEDIVFLLTANLVSIYLSYKYHAKIVEGGKKIVPEKWHVALKLAEKKK